MKLLDGVGVLVAVLMFGVAAWASLTGTPWWRTKPRPADPRQPALAVPGVVRDALPVVPGWPEEAPHRDWFNCAPRLPVPARPAMETVAAGKVASGDSSKEEPRSPRFEWIGCAVTPRGKVAIVRESMRGEVAVLRVGEIDLRWNVRLETLQDESTDRGAMIELRDLTSDELAPFALPALVRVPTAGAGIARSLAERGEGRL